MAKQDPDLALKWLLDKPDKSPTDHAMIDVLEARKRFEVSKAEFRAAIVAAYVAGASMRAIANAAGVSHQTVANLVNQL